MLPNNFDGMYKSAWERRLIHAWMLLLWGIRIIIDPFRNFIRRYRHPNRKEPAT